MLRWSNLRYSTVYIFLFTGKVDAPEMSRVPVTNNQTAEQCSNQAVDLSITKTENGQNVAHISEERLLKHRMQ